MPNASASGRTAASGAGYGTSAHTSSTARRSARHCAIASSRPAPKLASCAHRLVDGARLAVAMCQ